MFRSLSQGSLLRRAGQGQGSAQAGRRVGRALRCRPVSQVKLGLSPSFTARVGRLWQKVLSCSRSVHINLESSMSRSADFELHAGSTVCPAVDDHLGHRGAGTSGDGVAGAVHGLD